MRAPVPTSDSAPPADAAAVRAAYVEACARYGRRERARLQEEIATRDARLARLGDELRAVSRERDNSRRRLATVDAVLATEQGRFERDFEALSALPGVRGVEIDDALIRVLTEPVIILHEGASYRIGEFAIDVDLDRGVRISNLSNTSRTPGWDHPHVQATLPCLGNLQEGCEILLGQLEIVPLVSLLLQFLETYNPVTAYGPISLWERTAG
jgi:hypothetical protein